MADAQDQCAGPMHRSNAQVQCTGPMHMTNAQDQCKGPMHTINAQDKCTGPIDKENRKFLFRVQQSLGFFFHTYDKSVIFNCQYFCGYLPLDYQLDMHKLMFFKYLSNYPDSCLAKLFYYFSIGNRLHNKYDILVTDSISCIKLKVHRHFELLATEHIIIKLSR